MASSGSQTRFRRHAFLLTASGTVLLSLVDSLRCPADHKPSTLVLSAEQWAEGRVSSGFLGCPVCHARYAIRDGVADFTRGVASAANTPSGAVNAADGLRLAAQLDLSDGGGLVLLAGSYADHAPALDAIAHVTCVLLDAGFAIPASMQAVGIRLLDRIPLVDGSLRAAAVDESGANLSFLAEVSRCVRDGGRVVAPVNSPMPRNVRLLARDEREWVGQIERLPSLVTPQRRVSR